MSLPKLPLKAAYKRAWLKALRSGEYFQGQGWLFTGPGECDNREYACCMGVAVDLFVDVDWVWYSKRNAWGIPDENILLTKFPPISEMLTWFKGNPTEDQVKGVRRSLAHLNDIRRQDFKQIASWIEANL